MCLLLLAYDLHPRYRLILAANRDEFYRRPTAAACFWADTPGLFAGRDLAEGGTWLGVTGGGRFAALTNYRDPHSLKPKAPSRGGLVRGYLASEATPEGYLAELRRTGEEYNGFNLIWGDLERLYYFSNKGGEPKRLTPGCYGLSNALLDTPWPKVVRGRSALAELVARGEFTWEELFALLADRTPAPDAALPDTGVGLEWERLLSSIFIAGENYGTRSSTLVLVDRAGEVSVVERSFNGGPPSDVEAAFVVTPSPPRPSP